MTICCIVMATKWNVPEICEIEGLGWSDKAALGCLVGWSVLDQLECISEVVVGIAR